MRADVLARRDRGARRSGRTGLRLADAAKRQFAQRRQRPDGDTGTGQETAAIHFAARLIGQYGPVVSTTHRFFEQHDYFSCRAG